MTPELISALSSTATVIITFIGVLYAYRQYKLYLENDTRNKVKGIRLIESEARSLDEQFKILQTQLNIDNCMIENFDRLLSVCGAAAWNKYKFDLLERKEMNIHQIQRLERFYKQCCEVDDIITRCRNIGVSTRIEEFSNIGKNLIQYKPMDKNSSIKEKYRYEYLYNRTLCAHNDYVERLKCIVSEREEISSILDILSNLEA